MHAQEALDRLSKRNILEHWRTVELLNVNQTPRTGKTARSSVVALRKNDPFPWERGHPGHLAESDKSTWFHMVYVGIGDRRSTVMRLLDSVGAEISPEDEDLMRLNGDCWTAALMTNHTGRPIRESYTPASFAVAGGLLRRKQPIAEAMMRVTMIQQRFLEEHPEDAPLEPDLEDQKEEDESGNFKRTLGPDPIRWDHLETMLHLRSGLLGDFDEERPDIIVESIRVDFPKHGARMEIPESSFMNSFFLQDLNMLIDRSVDRDYGGPLDTYLGPSSNAASRLDLITDPAALAEAARPDRLTLGRWPAPSNQSLAIAQQAAVGEAIHGKDPLIAVNGPPGTGKTTLLRDIIAEIIVLRAAAIAKLKDARYALSSDRGYVGAKMIQSWNPAVTDGFGIVVTSSNNAAVENISRELPGIDSISQEEFRGAAYLRQTAQMVAGKAGHDETSVWGLVSAVMGSKKNCRTMFYGLLDFTPDMLGTAGAPCGFGTLGRTKRVTSADWETRRREFLQIRESVTAHIDLLNQVWSRSGRNGVPEDLARKAKFSVPDESFFFGSNNDRQLVSMWTGPEFEKARSRLFIAALRLIEATLMINSRTVTENLRIARDVITGKVKEIVGPEAMKAIWDTIFFVIPSISTTLASFRRLFNGLGRGAIGWLLMDEAGQAVPQAVAGALYRSKRAVIIGDPFQVEPVQTVPHVLIEKIREMADVPAEFSPAYASVQTVADRTMRIGGEVVTAGGGAVWAGLPLRAHRRCAEPMFGVSNQIAYAGQMVQAAPRRPVLISPFGASSWIDVDGTSQNHVVREEMVILDRMLRSMAREWPQSGGCDASVFIISPFRRVQAAAENLVDKNDLLDRIACGTIHGFQGREADIVLLALGSASGSAGQASRDWASARPNVLNVALTRARSRVHVIGSITDWSRHPFFDVLARVMENANRTIDAREMLGEIA